MADLLFRHLLESTLLCIAFGSVTFFLRRQRAAVRHSMWLIGMLKFSVPTALLAATGAWMAVILPASAWVSSLAAKFSAVLASLFQFLPSHIDQAAASLTSFAFLAIWILGSAIMFGAWFTRLRKSYDGLLISSNQERAALDQAERELGLRTAVGLRWSEAAAEPVLAGVFRPFIAMPAGLPNELTAHELEAVLVHELAHARRRDNLVSALVHCLVCVFWFHPLLWFVEKRLIAERERACDEAVIDCGVSPETYVAGLAKVCRFHFLGNVAGVSAVGGSDLGARFDHILSYRVSQPIPYLARFAMAGLALLVTMLPIAGGYCEQCVSNGRGMTGTSLQVQPGVAQIQITK